MLLVGAINGRIYPMRSQASTAKKAWTKVIFIQAHPGYRDHHEWSGNLLGMCRVYATDTLTQQRNYMTLLSRSRLCLVGSRSSNIGYRDVCGIVSWTLRKYPEAMAAGCVVVGDVPGDARLARLVPVRLTGQSIGDFANSVERAVDTYKEGEYTRLREVARETALTNYTYSSIIERYFVPALAAFKAQRRGVFSDTRTPVTVSNAACAGISGHHNSTAMLRNSSTLL